MDIAITGSTGLIGTALTASLRADGHRVVPIVRADSGSGTVRWDPAAGTIDATALEGIDAVVHLAGEGIAAGPWTTAQRQRIHDSRSRGTTLLCGALAGLASKPSVLVSGSAIGYYGDRGDEVLTESSASGDDFLAGVCRDWEAPTRAATEAGIRTAIVRTGIVLSPKGGSLGAQLPAFKLGLGAKAGRGDQWISWITLRDEVAAIRHAIDTDAVVGPVNLVAPNPVTNAAFTDAVGDAVKRPTFLTIPRAVRHLPFGVGDLLGSLLFTSDRVTPGVLTATGFTFADTDLEAALGHLLPRR
ncbi:TIGR01777 family oxidoreductase [Aquihabitans sp. G128]|uniref:TIGR01777 family oxidoreductase n=1 Tax=Aquihabitans sp. G128 TaxID=2849779 RepID=UPI001C226FC7|nr:TIGR01777 family oxidoreductase [Aquihabitans sp. G128]QXC61269.1 TIGR01777 family oxidoreductase [Aquihabitans sp. G128]QXC61322.1 TIGR01777 family oxidoreductase [Aquihabitans sp. G128]